MESGRPLDLNLYRRNQLISTLARWVSLALGLLALVLLWDSPRTRPLHALAVGAAYAAWNAASRPLRKRFPRSRPLKVGHDVADALAVGFGAAFTGAMAGPVWLLLYPHVVAVSVRGGLRYALGFGALDAGIVTLLAILTPGPQHGALHAIAILWCAFMGGTTSSYLHQIQRRLRQANQELSSKNEQLSGTIGAHEAARREQELALERLRDSEERYRRLLERIQDGVLIIVDGRIAYANQVFASMVGDTPQGLVGADLRELVPPEDRKEIQERYRRWEESHAASGELESRLRMRTGATLLVSIRAGSVEFEGRRSVIATIRDITRERRMERDLKAHAERLAAINEIAHVVNQSLTIEDIVAVAAEEARRIVAFDRLVLALLDEAGAGLEVVAVGPGSRRHRTGLRREQVAWAFRRPLSWRHGSEEPMPPHLLELLADPKLLSAATIPLQSKDRVIGSLTLGRLQATAFSSLDLAVMEPVASHIAIALDNARLLEAVRRRGREFESLVEIGRRIVERHDLRELLPLLTRSVNRIMGTHFCVLLLKSGEELVVGAQEGLEPEVIDSFRGLRLGESLSGWVAKEGRPLAIADMREDPRLKFSDVVHRFGYRSFLCVPLRRGAEVLGTLEVVTKEIRRFDPEDQDIMAAFADQAAVAIDNARLFQQMADANRRLEELDSLRQQYLRNVSHEFRTPLTVIRGYAEYLMDAAIPDEASLRDLMRIIVESSDRVIDMVDTLIEVSRVEQGARQVLQVRELDLREVVTSSLGPLKAGVEKKGVSLVCELPGESLCVQADSGLLHHVVRKLVDNAVKYSPPGGRVVVRGRPERDGLCLEVEDQGIGIPAEHLPRIFEKFYMVDGGMTRRLGGAGVGLYLVREIVRLHSGTIDVRSLPGEGSLFSVWLPKVFREAPSQTALA
jgi:PAS domain S-box-containing protein